MHPNAQLVDDFYGAFRRRDHAVMAASYHPEAVFTDPVFPHLEGEEIGAMWRMLCIRGEDLELEWSGVEAGDEKGTAHWEVRYTFRTTGRPVHNRIDAVFTFRDGKIYRHLDCFDFYRWSRMALGPAGLLLGWTPFLQKKVQRQAATQLTRFRAA